MRFFTLSEKTEVLLALFGLSFVIFGWYALSLTLAGIFHSPLVALGLAVTIFISLLLGSRLLSHASWDLRIVFLIALLYAVFIGYITEPTLFSGRDQGSIAEAAYRLAQNGELAFSTPASDSFFQIYGEGTALNFPGFAYTKEGYLMTQFPLGYTAWLASFVSLFGLAGYAIGNALLLFLFLLTFYGLLRLFVSPFYALFGFALAVSSFLPAWFAKITLTENLSIFLFTILIYSLYLFLREGKFVYYASILFTAGLFAFTRIEGFVFLFLTLVFLGFRKETRALFSAYPWKSIAIPGIIFLFFFLRDFFLNLPYYKMIAKALIKFLQSFGSEASAVAGLQSSSLNLGSIFFLYGLLALFFIGLFGILIFLKEKRFLLLLPVFIGLPVFVYLFHPSITLDHPWMLRRYLFSLYPTLLFSAVISMAYLFARDRSFPLAISGKKRIFFVSVIFISLIVLQYPAWNKQLTFAENKTLLDQIENFSRQFGEKDLILVDRNATGNGFSMLSGPANFLFKKNTAYFFNPLDLAALDTSHYEHIYLLVPADTQSRYASVFGEKLIFRQPVVFSLEQLEYLPLSSKNSFHLPEKTVVETHNLLFQVY